MENRFNIALDGPAGAGKSTIADAIADCFGLVHLDTGAMYRGAALYLSSLGIEPQYSEQMQQALDAMEMDFENGHLIINGEDVSGKIRTPEVSLIASKYSAIGPLRRRLVSLQQAITARQGFIVDGRDICDVVLPDAQVKIYLDASPKARALRRMKQDAQKGIAQNFDEVLREIEERDYRDMHREQSPLKISADAVVVDSSDLSQQQTIDKVAQIVCSKLSLPACSAPSCCCKKGSIKHD